MTVLVRFLCQKDRNKGPTKFKVTPRTLSPQLSSGGHVEGVASMGRAGEELHH